MMNRTIFRRLAAFAVCLALLPGRFAFAADAPDETAAPAEQAAAEEQTPPAPAVKPDPAGVITFENLDARLLNNGLAGRIMAENIGSVSGTNFENLQEELREQLNTIAGSQWEMLETAKAMSQFPGVSAFELSSLGMAHDSFSSAYDAVREQYDAIKDGTLQKDTADAIRMLENLRDTMRMGGEALYIGVSSVAAARDQVRRQLDALDRVLAALELRHELGHISDLTLEQQYANRAALASALETLDTAASTYIMHLEEMVGAPVTGTSVLGPLPEVTAEQLDAMNLETDLAAAKEASYALYAAGQDLEDARDNWKDSQNYTYEGSRLHFIYVQAEHTWQAAQLTYDNEVQGFERRFQVLYLQVKDDAQILAAKEAALETERRNHDVAELKYGLGMISNQDLLSAGDALSDAQDAVESAKRTLFAAWNSYRWAVDYGILGETNYVSMGGSNV